MLMMMRADEGYTPNEKCSLEEMVACALADDTDACLAACTGNEGEAQDEDQTVNATLKVSVKSNNGDALINGDTDLDVISLSSDSEDVIVNKVTLERVGYSLYTDVASVWLEDSKGAVIAEGKPLNSKDQVTLTIKKDYKSIKDNKSMTIVLKTNAGVTSSTIGFKVVNVDSNAKNVKIASYTPNQYNLVNYAGTNTTLTWKGADAVYHFAIDEAYEVARFKLQSSATSAALVNGFSVKNAAGGTLDIKDNVKDVTLTVDETPVKHLSWNISKDGELVVTFDNVTIPQKDDAVFAVFFTMNDDFEDFGDTFIPALSNFKITEEKTNTRITIGTTNGTAPTSEFRGSKITLTNKKLGTINAAAKSSDVVFADGTIDLGGQAIRVNTVTPLVIVASNSKNTVTAGAGIESMRLKVEGDEFDATCATDSTDAYKTNCTFPAVMTIEKNGKVRLLVDFDDVTETAAYKDTTISFDIASLNATTLGTVKYEESQDTVNPNDILGSISLYPIKVQAAKASLENNLSTKTLEFLTETTDTKTVFEGTYTAKKGTIKLNEITVTPSAALGNASDLVTLHVYINNSPVTDITVTKANGTTAISKTFNSIEITNTGSVKVEAEVYAAAANTTAWNYNIELKGEDSDGNEAGVANADSLNMKFVAQGSVNVTNSDSLIQNRVVLAGKNTIIASFIVKPSNGNEGIYLDDLGLDVSSIEATPVATNYKVTVDGEEIDDLSVDATTKYLVAKDINELLPAEGVEVVVTYKSNLAAANTTKAVRLVGVNKATYNTAVAAGSELKKYNILAADGIVKVTDQKNLGDETKWTFGVDTNEEYTVSALSLCTKTDCSAKVSIGNVVDGDTDTTANLSELTYIEAIQYTVNSVTYTITKSEFKDFFKLGDSYVKIFKASNN